MRTRNFLLIGMILLCKLVSAQRVITVQTGIIVKQYESLDSAMANVQNGDHVFIPGGVFSGNLVIDKGVMIFGAGHHPDSTLATGETFITGNVVAVTGASGGLITGCRIGGDFIVGTGVAGSDSVSNYTITRCNLNNISLSFTGLAPTTAKNFSISENIVHGEISGANAQNINFSKNIVEKKLNHFNGGLFSNNDFIGLGNCTTLVYFLNNVSSCTFENNIFLYDSPACPGGEFFDSSCFNNVFLNNLFRTTISFPYGTNTGFNSIMNQPVASVYNSATGDVFDYTSDYFLHVSSPGIHAGTDGYDVGIYGTIQPFKTASVPFNPHIRMKSVDTTTDPQGQLNIQINVAAQDY